MTSIQDKAATLRSLHRDRQILSVVNVWDAISTKVISDLPETKAIATAGHSIAASHGFPDGQIDPDVMFDALQKIVAATDLPVSADLDNGYDDPYATISRAIEVGIVGANVEDRLKPLDESVAVVEKIVAAAEASGLSDFSLNARTDAFVRGKDRSPEENLRDAIERGRAFLDAGADLVFVPGVLDAPTTEALVEAFNGQLSVIGLPGALSSKEYEELGVARISYGPMTQRYALTALQSLAEDLYAGGLIPPNTKPLN